MNYTKTFPFKEYRIQYDGLWTKATRTRNHWNETHTGKFICYDRSVENIMYMYSCPNQDCPSKKIPYARFMVAPYPAWKMRANCCECGVALVTEDICEGNPIIAP